MAPGMDIPNKEDYQKMIKIADAIGIKYNPIEIKPESKIIYSPNADIVKSDYIRLGIEKYLGEF